MSDQDSLLQALGRVAREQAAEAPPAPLSEPPSPEARARALARALAVLEAGAPEVAAPAGARGSWRGIRARLVGRRWWLALALPLAGAAAALLVFPRARGPGIDPLPSYDLMALGGIAETRAPGGAPLVLAPGAHLELRLRPAQAVAGPVAARLFWVKGGQVRRWPVAVEASAEGALRVRAPAEHPFGPGDGEVVAVVGRPATLPDQADAHALAAGRPGWQVLRWPVRWR